MKHRLAGASGHGPQRLPVPGGGPPPEPALPVTSHGPPEPAVGAGIWYRAVLCEARLHVEQVPVIQRHFVEALGSAGWPSGASLFVTLRRRATHVGDRPQDDALYFSPASISAVPHLIVASGACPSVPPDRAGATLLAGGSADWALLPFPIH